MIHVFLTMSYISHWEYRVTLPFMPTNTDFGPVVLSASLKAFYTLYTAVLVFLTQRLAMSRALVRRLKLTSIHDISGAWTGLGSALNTAWKQTGVPASLWATTAVTTYLVCISVLHVASSTLLQFQTFNSSVTTHVSTTLGWVDPFTSSVNWYTENWGAITASLPAISQFPALVSIGLSNNTVYDTSGTNSIVGHAMVNATTITSSCALLPNATYSDSTASFPLPNGNLALMNTNPPWTDQIQVLQPFYSGEINDADADTLPSVVLMVSTLLEIEPSLRKEVAVPMTWETPSSNYSIEVYFMQCLLLTNNTTVAIDVQTNALQNPMPISQPSTQWEEIYQWPSTQWSLSISQILSTSSGSGYQFLELNEHLSEPTIVDEYIMSLVGLNLTAQYLQWENGESPVSNFTLSPDKLEAAIAQAVAQITWMASRMGSNGGIPPGEGMALVDEEVIALRLNITLISLLFATSASVIMLGLALHMTRAFDASHNSQAAI
ncbi:hypothetical protein DEU56DRAFT_814728 [Suillus clintonianus]|uniref:uncharacterized protein n=1 Tax=Suillus clintonianus TaxID=1904413 RepID=UPI001B86062C|nr:uncharacterized protein DEU56DRAFT_814728 [Suillus clintonianus]KAG2130861.1 hypothetical protein DEU56DRAFT_814728 [Suillus clintonianus]